MNKTITLPDVDPHNIRWLSNQKWKWMPHLHFFHNCLIQHLKNTGAYRRHTPEELELNKALYYKLLLNGQEVRVNHCTFKLESADNATPAI